MGPVNLLIGEIEALVGRVESLPDPRARAAATELVQAVMALHEAALRRMLEIAQAAGPDALPGMTADELVAAVLALHGLHPDDLEERARSAMDRLQRYFDSRGGRIELLGLTPESVRVRVTGRIAAASARQVIEDAFSELVPEIAAIEMEGLEEPNPGFVPLADLVTPRA